MLTDKEKMELLNLRKRVEEQRARLKELQEKNKALLAEIQRVTAGR